MNLHKSVKFELTQDDCGSVWKTIGGWIHYYWKNGEWWCAPCDPRNNPMLTNTVRASGQIDGRITRPNGLVGLVEIP